jgi:hypothetical protein
MSFINALVWITVIYTVYYVVIILFDAFSKREVKEVTGVQEFTVERPVDEPTQVRNDDNSRFMPLASVSSDTHSFTRDDESEKDNFPAQEKEFLNESESVVQNAIKIETVRSDFPVEGQQLEIQLCIDEFMKQAVEDNSLLRQELAKQVRNVIY